MGCDTAWHYTQQHPETIAVNPKSTKEVLPSRFETSGPMLLAGFVERYNVASHAGIEDQWRRFVPHLGRIPAQIGPATFGVSFNRDAKGNFDYLAGVEVSSASNLPEGFKTLELPAHTYAVFVHTGPVETISESFAAIGNWFTKSGQTGSMSPAIERYGPEFDPHTGLGGFEIWIAVESGVGSAHHVK